MKRPENVRVNRKGRSAPFSSSLLRRTKPDLHRRNALIPHWLWPDVPRPLKPTVEEPPRARYLSRAVFRAENIGTRCVILAARLGGLRVLSGSRIGTCRGRARPPRTRRRRSCRPSRAIGSAKRDEQIVPERAAHPRALRRHDNEGPVGRKGQVAVERQKRMPNLDRRLEGAIGEARGSRPARRL